MSKRPAEDSGAGPSLKRPHLSLTPLDIGPATGEEDLNVKVLQVQNKKLSERLRERNRKQQALETRLQRLESSCDNHLKLEATLHAHLSTLRDHLSGLLAPIGASGVLEGFSAEVLGRLGPGMEEREEERAVVLGDVFQSVFAALRCLGQEGFRKLAEGVREGGAIEPEKLQSIEASQKELLQLLEDLRSKHDLSQLQTLREEATAFEARCETLENALADARFDLQKSQSQCDRLEVQLADALVELRERPSAPESPDKSSSQPSDPPETKGGKPPEKILPTDEAEQLQSEVAEQKAVAESRLREIEELTQQLQGVRKEVEVLKVGERSVPESLVVESPPFKALQTQFSIICQENSQLRASVEEAKRLLNSARSHHFMQLEEIRKEELKYQVEVREEMAQLEGALASVKRDYEILRIEFEKTIASNEQAAPIAKELQVTVDSLQKTTQQLKSEVQRYKTRAHKAEQQIAKLQEERDVREKPKPDTTPGSKTEGGPKGGGTDSGSGRDPSSEVQELQGKVRALQEEKRSLESQLEGFRAASKEERERGEIIAAEKKARAQVEEMRHKFEELRRDYDRRKEHLREESARRSKQLVEDHKHLQRELSAKKQEAQALMSEMEVTAQAFEEMQEQNIRLLQQLKEKDDANFKLMSERIKANSVQKLLLEEKELLQSQINAMATEKARLGELIVQLEEREKNSEASLQSLDKELSLRQQALEMHKRKSMENIQSLQEMQLRQGEVERGNGEMQRALENKTEECERETHLLRRSQEEVSSLKRKLERHKNREVVASSDEVLLEEIKTYKAKLNCPCCSTRKKDTVLTKCFHVFCSECIRNRYDSRLRKCPKCGAAFGANDFHKIYLS